MSVALGTPPVGTTPLAGYPFTGAGAASGLVWPLIMFELALPSNPLDASLIWTDVGGAQGNDIHEFSVTQNNRSSPLETSSKGTLSAKIDISRTRDLDPTNPGSAYAPNVKEDKPARLRIAADGATWPMWQGLVDRDGNGYRIDYAVEAFYEAYCTVGASDAFDLLGRLNLTGMAPRPKERADLRLNAVLDFVGWPASLRRISPARTILAAEDVSGASALDVILDIDKTECGRVRIDPTGVLESLSRHDVSHATRQTVSQATFSDSGAAGTIPYRALTPTLGLTMNVVDVSTPGGDTVHLEDETSRFEHGPAGYQREVRDATEAARAATAQHFLDTYKDGQIELSFTVDVADAPPGFPTGLFSKMASLWVGDRVTVERLFPPAGGDSFVADFFLESKADHAVIERAWTCDLTASLAPPVVTSDTWGPGGGKWGPGHAKWGW